jgi:hypothetical protein
MPPAVADPDFLKLEKVQFRTSRGGPALRYKGMLTTGELDEPNLLPQRDKQYDEDWTQPLLRLPLKYRGSTKWIFRP